MREADGLLSGVGCGAVTQAGVEWKVAVILEFSFTVTEGFGARREDRDQLAVPYSLTWTN